MSIKSQIKEKAFDIGFNLIGFTDPAPTTYKNEIETRTEKLGIKGLEYLKNTMEKRMNPKEKFPWAKGIIVLGVNYYQGVFPKVKKGECKISRYAVGRDYHHVLGKMLEELTLFIRSNSGAQELKYYTDTGPVLEKELARRAGLGWIGKNTLLITEKYGSWIFLGEIITDIDFEPDLPSENKCGDCSSCHDSCPSNALKTPYKLEIESCTSYQTTENPGPLSGWFPSPENPFVFGCDICQEVCPYNRNVEKTGISEFIPDDKLINPEIEWLLNLNSEEFKKYLGHTPAGWVGRELFLRNVRALSG